MQRNLEAVSFWLLLFFISLLLFSKAARKPFWFDEILTLRIAQCRLGPEMWQAITAGFEFNPPAIYVATKLSEMTFGRGLIASRLPSILGGLIALFCIFRVSFRRGGAAAGFGALFLLFSSGAFSYFIEARSYALVMAGVMIAWVSWQRRVDNARHQPLQLLGIFLGLALALASHMWALVVPPCFVASAIARRLGGKVLDVAALGAMIAPGVVALSYAPIVLATRRIQFGGEIYNAGLIDAYAEVLRHIPLFLLVCAVVFVTGSLVFPRSPANRSVQPKNGLPLEDTVLALCLVCAPVAIYAITGLTHSVFMKRYALVAALGLTVLLAQTFCFFARSARTTCYALLFVLGLGLAAHSIRSIAKEWHAPDPVRPELLRIAQLAGSDEPVVYSSGIDFLQADYYATPRMAAQLVYVADRQLAKQTVGTDGLDSAFILGRGHLSLRGRIVSYSELKSTHRTFWLVDDTTHPLNWISEQLRADGAHICAVNIPKTRIFHVDLR